jgi:hypothetical protein
MKDFKFGKRKETTSSLVGGDMFFQTSKSLNLNIVNRDDFYDYSEYVDRICEFVGESISNNSQNSLHTQYGVFSIINMSFLPHGHHNQPTYSVEVRHWPEEWHHKWIDISIQVTNDYLLSDMVFTIESFWIEDERLPF